MFYLRKLPLDLPKVEITKPTKMHEKLKTVAPIRAYTKQNYFHFKNIQSETIKLYDFNNIVEINTKLDCTVIYACMYVG